MTKRHHPPSQSYKTQPPKKFYAVAVGRKAGVYDKWADCERQVKKYSGALFQSFPTRAAATEFVQQHRPLPAVVTSNQHTLSEPPTSEAATPVSATLTNHKKRKRATSRKVDDDDDDDDNSEDTNTWRVKLMFDGGARGNPGPGGAGAIVTLRRTRNGNSNTGPTSPCTTTTIRIRHFLGKCTNNEAEYCGLCKGLEVVLEELDKSGLSSQSDSTESKTMSPNKVSLHIVGDSQLILRQVQGDYKCHKKHLRVYLQQVQGLLSQISSRLASLEVHYQHVLRAQNTIADGLANQAMDERRSWTSVGDDDETKPLP